MSVLQSKPCWNGNEDFFSFTRGRFIRDKARELSQRYVKFNVDELARLAAQASGTGSCQCEKVDKLPDGMHNKALLFTMNNGIQVVGKVPNPNAGRPHFTTASEVATMDFMRNVMGTPVPKVLAWSSKSDNTVGAEYIIMEKLQGVQLDRIWERLDVDVQLKVLKQIAKYQESWTFTCFDRFGGLYYKEDLASDTPSLVYTNKEGQRITDHRFAVGPSPSRHNSDDGRMQVEFDRGPCKLSRLLRYSGDSAAAYEMATGIREISCIEQLPQLPQSPISFYYSRTYQPSRRKKVQADQYYLKLVKYLLPDEEFNQTSHIWHDDLHAENIFVNPNDPSGISGLIDWQSTELAPLYDHTLEPYLIDYDGPPMQKAS
ncbi:kinase-like domain-containing protein [Lipomyces kononenkoae]